jgi:hypothetical protein
LEYEDIINYDDNIPTDDFPYWQDGITRIINGYPHIYGCIANYDCLFYDGPFNNYRIICDCPCHNDRADLEV